MKELLKKYYMLDQETKDDLEMLYIYQKILQINEEYPDIKIKNITEIEILIQVILKCTYCTSYSIDDIITRIFETISCRDITIKDLDDLEIGELVEILFNDTDYEEYEELGDNDLKDESKCNKKNIMDNYEYLVDFHFEDSFYICYKQNEKYKIVQIKGEEGQNGNIIIFNCFDDIIKEFIKTHIEEL